MPARDARADHLTASHNALISPGSTMNPRDIAVFFEPPSPNQSRSFKKNPFVIPTREMRDAGWAQPFCRRRGSKWLQRRLSKNRSSRWNKWMARLNACRLKRAAVNPGGKKIQVESRRPAAAQHHDVRGR